MQTTQLVIRCEKATFVPGHGMRKSHHGLCLLEIHSTTYSTSQETVVYVFHSETGREANTPVATYVHGFEHPDHIFNNPKPFETMELEVL